MNDMLLFVAMVMFTGLNLWASVIMKVHRPVSPKKLREALQTLQASQIEIVSVVNKNTMWIQLLYEDIHRDIPPCVHTDEHGRHVVDSSIPDVTDVTEL